MLNTEDEFHGPPAPLNADDFVTTPPERIACRRLLEELSGNAQRILAWNRLIHRFIMTDAFLRHRDDLPWYPDLSDEHDRWIAPNLDLSATSGNDTVAASLLHSRIEYAFLPGADLAGCRLDFSSFNDSSLYESNFCNAVIQVCSLDRCHLGRADFTGSTIRTTSFCGAEMSHSIFHPSHTSNCDLSNISFSELRLIKGIRPVYGISRPEAISEDIYKLNIVRFILSQYLHFKFVITNLYANRSRRIILNYSSLDGADLREIIGFTPNGESARGTRFDAKAADPYSLLRRKYTGPMMLFHLILVAIFFLPYIMKAGAWTIIERAQNILVERGLTETTLAESEQVVERFVGWVVLGFGEGVSGLMMGLIAVLFVIYNLARVYVTRRMSLLRDAEERSGYLPEMKEYWLCFSLHRYFLVWVYMLAMASFAIHFVSWMLDTVYVPRAMGM